MWNWLKKLWKKAKKLMETIFQAFIEWVLTLIEVFYLAYLTSVILTYFAVAYLLYFLFYILDGEAVVEMWEPQGESVISKLEKAPSNVVKPNRKEATVLKAVRN
ncbi:hypothetical protein [Lyngbya sp. CCY1209]|uniref:hypothetical protein n=1 Tax=Lyngbya sp. CCY1209 TaxID=2886103 RepID=UPI002D205F9F|nr:hypothetical protein [Lyngbya sp. CCY1209]MEB3883012.1 hypothetical protein [Lyngbya sp. CCY1209]